MRVCVRVLQICSATPPLQCGICGIGHLLQYYHYRSCENGENVPHVTLSNASDVTSLSG